MTTFCCNFVIFDLNFIDLYIIFIFNFTVNAAVKSIMTFKMETLKIKQQSQFLSLVINFYRILGITFSGISLDKNGNIFKSKFWHHFGWLSFVIYLIPLMLLIIALMYDYSILLLQTKTD